MSAYTRRYSTECGRSRRQQLARTLATQLTRLGAVISRPPPLPLPQIGAAAPKFGFRFFAIVAGPAAAQETHVVRLIAAVRLMAVGVAVAVNLSVLRLDLLQPVLPRPVIIFPRRAIRPRIVPVKFS